MKLFNIQIQTPEKLVLKDTCLSLSVLTPLGRMVVLPNHTPLITTLTPGELEAVGEHGEYFLHIAGGVMEVQEDHAVTILADAAEHHYEIDVSIAEAAKEQARVLLSRKNNLSSEEITLAQIALERSLARLSIARKHAHRRKVSVTGSGILEK